MDNALLLVLLLLLLLEFADDLFEKLITPLPFVWLIFVDRIVLLAELIVFDLLEDVCPENNGLLFKLLLLLINNEFLIRPVEPDSFPDTLVVDCCCRAAVEEDDGGEFLRKWLIKFVLLNISGKLKNFNNSLFAADWLEGLVLEIDDTDEFGDIFGVEDLIELLGELFDFDTEAKAASNEFGFGIKLLRGIAGGGVERLDDNKLCDDCNCDGACGGGIEVIDFVFTEFESDIEVDACQAKDCSIVKLGIPKVSFLCLF